MSLFLAYLYQSFSEEPRLSGGAVNHFRKSRKPLLADVHIQPSSPYMLEMTVVCKVSGHLLNPPRTGRPSCVLGDGQLPTKLVSYGLHSKSGKHFSRLTVQLLLQSGRLYPSLLRRLNNKQSCKLARSSLPYISCINLGFLYANVKLLIKYVLLTYLILLVPSGT